MWQIFGLIVVFLSTCIVFVEGTKRVNPFGGLHDNPIKQPRHEYIPPAWFLTNYRHNQHYIKSLRIVISSKQQLEAHHLAHRWQIPNRLFDILQVISRRFHCILRRSPDVDWTVTVQDLRQLEMLSLRIFRERVQLRADFANHMTGYVRRLIQFIVPAVKRYGIERSMSPLNCVGLNDNTLYFSPLKLFRFLNSVERDLSWMRTVVGPSRLYNLSCFENLPNELILLIAGFFFASSPLEFFNLRAVSRRFYELNLMTEMAGNFPSEYSNYLLSFQNELSLSFPRLNGLKASHKLLLPADNSAYSLHDPCAYPPDIVLIDCAVPLTDYIIVEYFKHLNMVFSKPSPKQNVRLYIAILDRSLARIGDYFASNQPSHDAFIEFNKFLAKVHFCLGPNAWQLYRANRTMGILRLMRTNSLFSLHFY